jgi:hypothetical protein
MGAKWIFYYFKHSQPACGCIHVFGWTSGSDLKVEQEHARPFVISGECGHRTCALCVLVLVGDYGSIARTCAQNGASPGHCARPVMLCCCGLFRVKRGCRASPVPEYILLRRRSEKEWLEPSLPRTQQKASTAERPNVTCLPSVARLPHFFPFHQRQTYE